MRFAAVLVLVAGLGGGCAKSLDEIGSYPCAEDGSCPEGLVCESRTCSIPHVGSRCSMGVTNCALAGSGVDCVTPGTHTTDGTCQQSCIDGAGCMGTEVCSTTTGVGACFDDCSVSGTCTAGLDCVQLDGGQHVCQPASCEDVAPTSCRGEVCGQMFNATVPCGAGLCPSNSTCDGGSGCACGNGFAPTACDGTPCAAMPDAKCENVLFWCEPDSSLVDCDHTYNDLFKGKCDCSDGFKASFACNNNTTCEDLCRRTMACPTCTGSTVCNPHVGACE